MLMLLTNGVLTMQIWDDLSNFAEHRCQGLRNLSVRDLLEISKDAYANAAEGECVSGSPRAEPAKGKERAAREGGDEGVDDEAKEARVVFHTPSSSALLEEVDVDDAIPPFADAAPGARPESRGASKKHTRADWTASAEPSPEGKKDKEDGLRVSTGTRPSRSPASPSDAPLLDFHFGKPRAAATTPRSRKWRPAGIRGVWAASHLRSAAVFANCRLLSRLSRQPMASSSSAVMANALATDSATSPASPWPPRAHSVKSST